MGGDGNGSGKTFLLKSIYCSLRTLEDYKRGNEQRSASEDYSGGHKLYEHPVMPSLADKLYWTFQAEKIGEDLAIWSARERIHPCRVRSPSIKRTCRSDTIDQKDFFYSFGKDTSKQISSLDNNVPPRASNSVFLPAKEVLSLHRFGKDTSKQISSLDNKIMCRPSPAVRTKSLGLTTPLRSRESTAHFNQQGSSCRPRKCFRCTRSF